MSETECSSATETYYLGLTGSTVHYNSLITPEMLPQVLFWPYHMVDMMPNK